MENTIKSIDPTSPLHGKAQAGDTVLAINDNRILDVLDYKFFAYDPKLDVLLRRPDGEEYHVHVLKNEGGDLGLDFESYLMDAPRPCANRCVFCFIDQLPKGMRPTMYFKDDDARLSFLLAWRPSSSAGRTARASAPPAARTLTLAPADAGNKLIQDLLCLSSFWIKNEN